MKFGHVEDQGPEAAGDQFVAEVREPIGNKDAVVYAHAVGAIAFGGRDADLIETGELRIRGHLIHDDEGVVADVTDAAFEMQDGGHGADVDGGGGVAVGAEKRGELARSFFVSAQ